MRAILKRIFRTVMYSYCSMEHQYNERDVHNSCGTYQNDKQLLNHHAQFLAIVSKLCTLSGAIHIETQQSHKREIPYESKRPGNDAVVVGPQHAGYIRHRDQRE